jgi:hypothetical protein
MAIAHLDLIRLARDYTGIWLLIPNQKGFIVDEELQKI